MKNSSVKAFLALIFILSSTVLTAQYHDFRSWWNLEVTNDLMKDLNAGVKLSQRFDENSLGYDRSQATFTLDYELFKNVSFEGGFRFVLFKDEPSAFAAKYRVHGNVNYEKKFSSFSLDFRDQLQYGIDDLHTIDYFRENKFVNRTRLGADYSIFGTPLTAHVSYELFMDLNSVYGVILNAYRIKLGMKYTLSGKSKLDLSYMLEDEFNVVNPITSHILVVSYAYKF